MLNAIIDDWLRSIEHNKCSCNILTSVVASKVFIELVPVVIFFRLSMRQVDREVTRSPSRGRRPATRSSLREVCAVLAGTKDDSRLFFSQIRCFRFNTYLLTGATTSRRHKQILE